MGALVGFIPAIVQVIFMILEFLTQKKVVSEESKRIFINMAEELRKMGIKDVRSRYEAEKQLDSNDQAWTEIENKEKSTTKVSEKI